MLVAVLAAVVVAVALTLAVTAARRLRAAQAELVALRTSQAEEAALAAERAGRIADLVPALDAERQENRLLAAEAATLRATLAQERTRIAEMRDDREQMASRFRQLADETMLRHGETFARQNREQIDTTLAPLREKIAEFQQGLQAAHAESVTGRALLAGQIARLSEDSAKVRSEAENLATALRGQSQMRGAWGEMILATILEKSGLRAGEEYSVQQSHVAEDGQRLRPDAIVNLPGGQRIVIDSKVSLTAFAAYVNAASEDDRAQHLARHVAAMRAQIRELAGKSYHAVTAGSLDYVVMFVPIEGALAAALQTDTEITGFALASRVCIATPTTLMIALRTAADVWSVERRNRNADEIAARAGKVYDKLVAFVDDMTTLGNRLTQARDSYDDAMKKLATGNGNALRQLQQLKAMGARTTKSLPAALVEEAEPVGSA